MNTSFLLKLRSRVEPSLVILFFFIFIFLIILIHNDYFFLTAALWIEEGNLHFAEATEAHGIQELVHSRPSDTLESVSLLHAHFTTRRAYVRCFLKASELNVKVVNFIVCELDLQ